MYFLSKLAKEALEWNEIYTSVERLTCGYSYESKSQLVGYADAGYLSDPH